LHLPERTLKRIKCVRLIGVDGCKAGWIYAAMADGARPELGIASSFAELQRGPAQDSIIAIDMPIGLPEHVNGSGRGPEQAVRPLLGARQSTVFAIPARAALYAVVPQPSGLAALQAGHRIASEIAKQRSDPPRGISFQAFNLFPKIREIDLALRNAPDWQDHVFEVHPEVAFWRLNGEKVLETPKKTKGQPNADGMAQRRALLISAGLPRQLVEAPVLRGAAEDDQLDALACLCIAQRIARGEARPFPENFARDAHGLRVAIWA
jgi:predicted RNase H-like nuclease